MKKYQIIYALKHTYQIMDGRSQVIEKATKWFQCRFSECALHEAKVVAEKDKEIERLKGELKIGNGLTAKLTDKCRELEQAIASERERIAGEIATMLDIHEDDTYCRISNHVQYSEFEARYIKREEGR